MASLVASINVSSTRVGAAVGKGARWTLSAALGSTEATRFW